MKAKIAVIGGSGLYQLPGLTDVWEQWVETPFGTPSDAVIHGKLGDVEVCFLPRHGRGHHISPSEVNYCANIAALKLVGCTHILSVSAVGSMKEEIPPGDLVLVDQFIDWTRGKRRSTFFGESVVGHVSVADPICMETQSLVHEAARELKLKVHRGGTYICIEGPQFSTKAESNVYRSWGVSVIGMTNAPEFKLAREIGLSYVTIAMATDYDCWHASHGHVTVEEVIRTLQGNVEKVKKLLVASIPLVARKTTFPCRGNLWSAVMTASDKQKPGTLDRLKPLLGE